MVFSSLIFIFVFLPFVLLIHSLLFLHIQNKQDNDFLTTLLNLFLLLSSMVFYAWGEPRLVILLILCAYINFHAALLIEKRNYSKLFFAISVTINLGLLACFKYAMLFISPGMITLLNKALPQSINLKDTFTIALPLGISFYIFQAISYQFDVYRKKVTASQKFIDFACYLTMFPQLIAGPIVRYSQIVKELKIRTLNISIFTDGASRFTFGLAKKVLIADTLGKVADAAFSVPHGELTAYGAWIGIICYTFQIYYDFSGYSDMAIGIGNMLGFRFPENFNYPYIADSIQNFWQRWHLSLSGWFRDYLYIPLGGSRRGKIRTYSNLFIVFLLCGFWHGASWTFMAWGAYYGFFLVLERIFSVSVNKIPRIIRHFYVLVVVIFGWVLFRADSFTHALFYVKSMLGSFQGSLQMNKIWIPWYGNDVTIALIFAVIFSYPFLPAIQKISLRMENTMNSLVFRAFEFLKYTFMILILLFCCMPLFGSTYNAFIYFRF
ncbi:MAG: MBOAT family protein [Desulfobacteraceae bacterium]|nr:MBOAT family protein [Desulfobacteraceae bacterium]